MAFVSSKLICEFAKKIPETRLEREAKFLELQRELKLQDVINEKTLNKFQQSYVKCTKGKCPQIKSERTRRLNKFLFNKKRKVNHTSVRNQDKKLSKIFDNVGRKKRIEILQAEVDELNLKLSVASGQLHVKETEDNYRKMEQNLRLQEDMIGKIEKVQIEIGHIKSQMERIYRKSAELDQETEAEVPFFEHMKRANRQLEIYENRLQLSRQREGKTLAENKQLRELLCKMLYFRSIFMKYWKQIGDKLMNRKKFLLDMIERSSTAFNQDSDLMDSHKKLQASRNQDKELAITEMLTMKRQIDANDIIKLFLKQKGKYRPFEPLAGCEVARREAFKKSYNERLNFYRLILDEIKKYPGIGNSIKSTADFFLAVDNELYEYYRYRESINQRLEAITLLAEKSDKGLTNDEIQVEKLREYYKEQIKEREQTLQDEINLTMKHKMEHDKLKREIERYSNIFFKIMKILRCDLGPVNSLLRSHTVMDSLNIEIYMSFLENRMNEILAFLYCRQRSKMNMDIHTESRKLVVRSIRREYHPIPKINEIISTQQCPECAQGEDVNLQEHGGFETMMDDDEIRAVVMEKTRMPGFSRRMHNVSACNLPKSGIIASRRYAE